MVIDLHQFVRTLNSHNSSVLSGRTENMVCLLSGKYLGIAVGYEMNFLHIPVCCRRHLANPYRFRTLQKQAASDIRAVTVISAFHVSAGPEPAIVSYGVLC